MIPRLTTDDMSSIRMLAREVKLRIDPQFRGECAWLREDPRIAKAYFSRNGVTVDGFGELLLDRGLAVERPAAVDVLDLLELVFVKDPQSRRANAAEKRREIASLDREALRARNNRLRKFSCVECGAIAYASKETRISCTVDGLELTRVSKTFEEAMAVVAECEEAPF